MTWLIACVRGGFGPRSNSGHCRCEKCKSHYALKARERAERGQKLTECKNGNISERSKWGHCLCAVCAEQRKERGRAYSKKWNEENVEKRRAIEKHWKDRNPDKVASYSKAAGAKWAKNNKGKRLASVRARQLAKARRTPLWADLKKIAEIYQAAADATIASGVPHEVDHIIPLQGKTVSGLHVHQNLRVITRQQNRSKHNVWDGGSWELG